VPRPKSAANPFVAGAVRLCAVSVDAETSYWRAWPAYIKNELKGSRGLRDAARFSPAYIQAKLDYVDNHAYWRHPSGGWISLTAKEPWKIGNDAMVNSLGNILRLAGQRVLSKPYTISEYNHPYPNQYGAEAQTTLATYGALQGWDGIFQYSYNHYVNATSRRPCRGASSICWPGQTRWRIFPPVRRSFCGAM
jgi:hypothetical protein